MENNTILLTESGDLEVYEGKKPEITDNESLSQLRCLNNWLSQHKKVAKIAEGELGKLIFQLGDTGSSFTYPIDVSDIVTEKDGLYYFSPPVDKEEETQEENQTTIASEIIGIVKNHSGSGTPLFKLLTKYNFKRR